ncbi:RNA-binding domain-containing protein [Mesorhizobium huakuii]|uniref:DNA binding domain-containing protein n=1 Tax=Mesorhizobium huakuii TaxID=28104 RepID=A0ABZ0VQJ0_9HYPH|nr:RNA-binding domain-containing protein [Mesorhizobium huakuii]WQB99742.1 putative DNA binding domain-containing protein [Mesorhizobium huakuii]
MKIDSIYQRRSVLSGMLTKGVVDASVLNAVVVNGRPISEEAILWDFKKELPVLGTSKITPAEKQKADAKFYEIVKDCVSFYNSYGGYLIAGIDDDGKIDGFSGSFDAPDINNRIFGATGTSIETAFRTVDFRFADKTTQIGILFIPKRSSGKNPAQFKKNAPDSEYGRKAFNQGDFYFRIRDTCSPARTPEDFEFLYGDREVTETAAFVPFLENNLPSRDPDLGELRGRDKEITSLWRWLSDQFSPVHILCGLGGLGKTSIAYTFAERVIFNSIPEFDRVVWLGAKAETYSGLKDKLIVSSRVDFDGIDKLLLEILGETGCPPQQIPDNPSRDQLMTLCSQHLSAYRYLLFIDNVDTLADEDQQLAFHLITQLSSMSRAKAIITARRNLGASVSIYTEIEGLKDGDFGLFVSDKARLLRIREPTSHELLDLQAASGGSPLFTLSLMRLVSLGDSYKAAVRNWKGSDGEAVRAAAFRQEIARLKAHEGRVLLALSYLDLASVTELSSVLGLSRFEVQVALEGLQAFSMTTIETSLPGGAVFKLPLALILVSALLEERVSGWQHIRNECQRLFELRENKVPFVGQAITRAVALLRGGEIDDARNVAAEALKALPDSPDLQCLLGRCLVEAGDPGAEDAYQRAAELGCEKRDLFEGLLAVRERSKDWRGIVTICNNAEEKLQSSRYCVTRNRAQINIGDEFARAGRYAEASGIYATSLEDIRLALQKYTYPPDRAVIWRLNEILVTRWLGAVRMDIEQQPDGSRRLFGVYHKAVLTYKYWNETTLQSALDALGNWLSRISARKEVSDTTKEHLMTAHLRLDQMRKVVEKKSTSLDFKNRFAKNSANLLEIIERLGGTT